MHLINIGSDDVTFNFVWLNRLVGRWEGVGVGGGVVSGAHKCDVH